MSRHNAATAALCLVIGATTGWLLGGAVPALVALAAAAGYATVANRFMVRTVVAVAVFAGTAVGVLLGRNLVRVLCLPGTCVAAETTAAVLLGIGASVGVGLVTALAVRSFDEYRGE